VSTLVVCVDRNDDIGRKAGVDTPVAGWEAVRSLVTDVGIADPEDSHVNSLLEALRVTRELRDDDEEAEVAVVSGVGESVVGTDRGVAAQMDRLIDEYDADSAVVVIDSAEDERLVPIIESRVAVDAVDRVVVRQARDLESTYYLLKQFLADEELRQAVLVPIGVALLVFPAILASQGPAVAVAALTAALGLFLLYKGFGVDEYASGLPAGVRDALYSGQVSLVTYVVAGGLALIGVFTGALAVSALPAREGVFIPAWQFVYDAVPWLAMAALTASTGRLIDEALQEDRVRNIWLNLPFVVLALGLVVRGFAGYFLEQDGIIGPLTTPPVQVGAVVVAATPLSPIQRMAFLAVSGILIALVGFRVASFIGGASIEEPDEAEAEAAE
jgi:putative membrane protein